MISGLHQRMDNTCIEFKEVSSADGGRHPRILTCLNHARLGWFDVRFAQKTTKLLRGSVTLSAKALNRCAIARGGGRGAHQYGSTRGEMVSSVWVIVS